MRSCFILENIIAAGIWCGVGLEVCYAADFYFWLITGFSGLGVTVAIIREYLAAKRGQV